MSLKQVWGNACWYLFHTLAFKLKHNDANLIRDIIVKIMYICKNLPCPECSQHAVETLSKLNINLVRTREALITVLLQFHNSVNRRTKKPEFSRKEYDEKYNKSNFDAIVIHFIKAMNLRYPTNERGMANELQRRIMTNNITEFITKNRHSFNN